MMSINILNYQFEGPFANTSDLYDLSGVYVILGNNCSGNWSIVDVGESEGLRSRVSNHDRAPCWRGQSFTNLQVAALYTDERARMLIEQQIRAQFNPPCGDR